MYPRLLKPTSKQSYFLFGPRGVGKSSWLKLNLRAANFVDLLDDELFVALNANPKRLADYMPKEREFTVIDEIQKIPHLLDEVHRLIETNKSRFILTGSSARKLRKSGVNLLAGRALTYYMHPLTVEELGGEFSLKKHLDTGFLPGAVTSDTPKKFLQSYLRTYLKEEVQLEGLTRNLAAFSRFLEAASFSQASPLNVSSVAADCSVERKVVEDYFSILRDLLLSIELPVFMNRAKRELIKKSKFFFFDCGVFKAIRPRGPLDSESELNGPALETLVIQNIVAMNDYMEWDYKLFYWHTKLHQEVDLVLYGAKGLVAIEVKNSVRIRSQDLTALKLFKADYPVAECYFLYVGAEEKKTDGITCIPVSTFLKSIQKFLS